MFRSAAMKREIAVWIEPAHKEKDPVDRKDHLIDPETFGADRAGERSGRKSRGRGRGDRRL